MFRAVHVAPSMRRPARFTVGRDHHGWWVVRDDAGLVGGLFCTQEAALHFAQDECARSASALRIAPRSEYVELENVTDDR